MENNQQKQEIKPIDTGTSIYDTETKKSFVIESFTDEDVNLRHIPRLRRDEPKNETWGWDELLKYFKKGEVQVETYEIEDYRQLKYDIAILVRDNKIKQLETERTAISDERTKLSDEKTSLEGKYKDLETERETLFEKHTELEQQYNEAQDRRAELENKFNEVQGELDKIKTLREKKNVLSERIELKKEQLEQIKNKKKKQELQDEVDMLKDLFENL